MLDIKFIIFLYFILKCFFIISDFIFLLVLKIGLVNIKMIIRNIVDIFLFVVDLKFLFVRYVYIFYVCGVFEIEIVYKKLNLNCVFL